MPVPNFFIGKDGHLRSGWRVVFFAVAFLVCEQLFEAATLILTHAIGGLPGGFWGDVLPFLIGAVALFSSATVIGWACGAIFEELPFSALGWWPHRGWLKNLAIGSLLGASSLLLAAGLTTITRGIKFTFNTSPGSTIGRTAIVSLVVFVVAAAAEESLFRGYALQTLTRARLVWVGVLLTSLPFAAVHLRNPNISRGFTFINTAVAGIWFCVAYLRTGSLWFPLGLHWAWNWTQASLLGLPVSGIQRLAPAPLLHAMNAGPDWLTGGAYGIEGGAACTVALVISTIVIWRMKFLSHAPVASAPSLQ